MHQTPEAIAEQVVFDLDAYEINFESCTATIAAALRSYGEACAQAERARIWQALELGGCNARDFSRLEALIATIPPDTASARSHPPNAGSG